MQSGSRWCFTFVLLAVVFSVLYVLPSFVSVEKINPIWLRSLLPNQKLNLGLDLAGGVHIVMGVRREETLNATAERDVEFYKTVLGDLVESVTYVPDTTHIKVIAKGEDHIDEIRKKVREQGNNSMSTQDIQGKEVTFGYRGEYEARILKQALDQTIQRIRNRIDEFGVAEPAITSQGNDRIVIQIPGYKDPKEAKEIIGKTAQLEFRLVEGIQVGSNYDGKPSYDSRVFIEPKTKKQVVLGDLVDQVEKETGLSFVEAGSTQSKSELKFSDYVDRLNKALRGKLPENTKLMFEKKEDSATGRVTRTPYLLSSTEVVTGEHLKNAYVGLDQMGHPSVDFEFASKGARQLAHVTRKENVGRQMAIILDGVIKSAPVLQTTLSEGRGQITLGSGSIEEKRKEADQIAIVLRAGALPAPLDFLFERTVGPSLGADSIAQSKIAMVYGALAVMIFMVIYYGLSGFVALIALVLNVLFILAILSMLQATLTLPGIAGIILTIGMAVDANVIIFERIREELDAGKMPHGAIEAGYNHAWSTVLDANVTTLIAAFVLLKYGTGSVKGFAVTLIIGIITSVFTAFFITKMIFSYFIRKQNIQRLSI
ncbi:MAG: protein translocase subunit SecD [Deltaproteobacteria bacterium]|nr:protein translocase subunit SecD [Deltaproteobacteria bacterium]